MIGHLIQKKLHLKANLNTTPSNNEDSAEPIVIDRYQFKADEGGYLTNGDSHLYLINLATKKITLLTPGDHDEFVPTWSPDGKYIAYLTKRGKDPDRKFNYNIFLIQPRANSVEQQLTYYQNDNLDPDFETHIS